MHSEEYWRPYNAQRACGFRYRDVWASKRPAAAEGDVQAHSEPACLIRPKAQIIDGINAALEQYRADKLKAEMAARAAAGMP